VAVIVIAGELTLGVLQGIALGVVLALLMLIYRASHPQGAVLGQLPGTEAYRDIRRHPEALTFPGLLIWRAGGDLFFASIGQFGAELKMRWPAAQRSALLVDADSVNFIDTSACDASTPSRSCIAKVSLWPCRVRDRFASKCGCGCGGCGGFDELPRTCDRWRARLAAGYAFGRSIFRRKRRAPSPLGKIDQGFACIFRNDWLRWIHRHPAQRELVCNLLVRPAGDERQDFLRATSELKRACSSAMSLACDAGQIALVPADGVGTCRARRSGIRGAIHCARLSQRRRTAENMTGSWMLIRQHAPKFQSARPGNLTSSTMQPGASGACSAGIPADPNDSTPAD
jgi:hypothetical protein